MAPKPFSGILGCLIHSLGVFSFEFDTAHIYGVYCCCLGNCSIKSAADKNIQMLRLK